MSGNYNSGKKTNLEIADSIEEPTDNRLGAIDSLLINKGKLISGIIDDEKRAYTAHKWSLIRTKIDGLDFHKNTVTSRINSGWSELEATTAPSGMRKNEVQRLLKRNEVRANKEYSISQINNIIGDCLSRPWI